MGSGLPGSMALGSGGTRVGSGGIGLGSGGITVCFGGSGGTGVGWTTGGVGLGRGVGISRGGLWSLWYFLHSGPAVTSFCPAIETLTIPMQACVLARE